MEPSKKLLQLMASYVTGEDLEILDPFAGSGSSIKFLKKFATNNCISACELDQRLAAHLQKLPTIKFLCKDFWELDYTTKFDLIFMIPPHRDNQDCDWIVKAFQHLKKKPESRLISLTLPYWVTGIYHNQKFFRKWLQDKNYKFKIIDESAYQDFLVCPEALLVIQP